MPGLLLGDVFPDFDAETTVGRIRLHEFLGDSWGILFSHPRDYTPVCTTELGRVARLCGEFSRRNVKVIALSIDSVEDHRGWTVDILAYNGCDPACRSLPYPIIADRRRELAVALGMLDPDEKDKEGLPLTARCVFIIGPDKRLKLSLLYPATTGRNFDEILRVVDSLQLTAGRSVATPADWRPGDCVMVPPSMTEEEAASLFPWGVYSKDLPSGRKYLRYTPQPSEEDCPQGLNMEKVLFDAGCQLSPAVQDLVFPSLRVDTSTGKLIDSRKQEGEGSKDEMA